MQQIEAELQQWFPTSMTRKIIVLYPNHYWDVAPSAETRDTHFHFPEMTFCHREVQRSMHNVQNASGNKNQQCCKIGFGNLSSPAG